MSIQRIDGLQSLLTSEAVREAAKQDFDWGLDFADALASANEWETDVWSGLMQAWRINKQSENENLNIDQFREALIRLANQNLHGKEERDYYIIWTLSSLIRASYAIELLPEANRIAASLWDKIDEHDAERPAPNSSDGRTAVHLASYWLDGLQLLRKDPCSAPKSIEGDWAEALSKIAQEPSPKGRAGRSGLAQRFAFLLHVDKRWTEENLLPYFSSPNDEEFLDIWQGFLRMWYPTKESAEMLSKPSYEAVKRILPNNDNMLCNSFIDYYAHMVAMFVEDPVKKWIPEFFKRSSEENRREFTHRLDSLIRLSYLHKQEDWLRDVWNRWLKRYWKNRLYGVPKPLDNEEIKKMFSWPIYFGSAFPEAVELAVKREPTARFGPVGSNFVRKLSDSDLWSKYPDAAAEMVLYIDKISSLWEFRSIKGKELIDSLLTRELPDDDLKRDLEDLRARLS